MIELLQKLTIILYYVIYRWSFCQLDSNYELKNQTFGHQLTVEYSAFKDLSKTKYLHRSADVHVDLYIRIKIY